VAGWPIDDALSFPHREIVRNGNGFVVGDQQTKLGARRRHQLLTRVSAPARVKIDCSARAFLCFLAVIGQFLLVGAPAQFAGCKPSDTNPSTDHVLIKTSSVSGFLNAGVSRSGNVKAFYPSRFMSFAQASRVVGSMTAIFMSRARSSNACLTSQDTMPGFAPQQETAVGPTPDFHASSAMASRIALIGCGPRYRAWYCIKSGPRLVHRIDAQRIAFARQFDDVDRTYVDGKVHDQGLPRTRREQWCQTSFKVFAL